MFQNEIDSSHPPKTGLFVLFFLAPHKTIWCPIIDRYDDFGEEQNHEDLLDAYLEDHPEINLGDLRVLAIGSYQYEPDNQHEPSQVEITSWSGDAYGEQIVTDDGNKCFAQAQLPIALKKCVAGDIHQKEEVCVRRIH